MWLYCLQASFGEWDDVFSVLRGAGTASVTCALGQSIGSYRIASGFPNEDAEDELPPSWPQALGVKTYQENLSFQPNAGRIELGCCDLPSSGFKCKIQLLALGFLEIN